ncbi:biotin--[acetyl-CoA-carboxylase] ligase [Piscinibacter gummiphilus]|uniref:biotin--[biotin carboxyl-carrier protein] ligase n=1 Tax=Piscinibacter gummiphilus TaxID=946333 RepID=A0ABZ0D189_9BURK|nr:biotin--[acetyl-CoA-carboxylase] ligase [Piscinibacter gummiphilus]WOB08833.1 biotin--[acetyl-CoA-carboxylase] ligase [Piscinibacter gummiphilus]
MSQALQWGAESLWQRLEPLLPGLSVEVVARSVSTNSALLERARVRAEPPTDELVQVRRSIESGAFGRRAADVQPCLLVAEHQTGGRGRLGRTWQASIGASLTFSLSLPMNPADWSGLSLAVGVAIADALDPAGARVGLKWPNDLWLMDPAPTPGAPPGRKLGGILIETVTAGPVRLAVIGIGLNITPQPLEDLSSGYACLQELDPDVTAPSALAQVAEPLVRALKGFERQGFAPFAARYAARDLLRGRTVTTTQANVPNGVAAGISPTGALLVRDENELHEVSSGEVSVRLARDDGGTGDSR